MFEKWYSKSKIPTFVFFIISSILLYFGREVNTDKKNLGVNLFYSVEVEYPGVDSSFLNKEIAIPLENKISSLKKLSEIRTRSENSRVVLELSFEKDADEKLTYCLLSNIIDEFYKGIDFPIKKPSISNSGINSNPDFLFAFYKGKDDPTLDAKLKNNLIPLLEGINGISKVSVYGNENNEIKIEYDEDIISQKKISPHELSLALQKTNPRNSIINFDSRDNNSNINIITKHDDLSQSKDFYIKKDEQYINVEESLRIYESKKIPAEIVKLNGEDCVEIDIRFESKANKILLSKKIKETIGDYFTEGEYAVLYDVGKSKLEDLRKISFALLQSFILVVVFIPLFFKGLRLILSMIFFISVSLFWILLLVSCLGIEIDHFMIAGISISLGVILDPVLIIVEQKLNSFSEPDFLKSIIRIIPSLFSSAGTNLIVFLPFIYAEKLVPGIKTLILSMVLMTAVSFLIAIFFFPFLMIKWKVNVSTIEKINLSSNFFKLNSKLNLIIYAAMILLSLLLISTFEKDFSLSTNENVVSINIEYNPERRKECIDENIKKIIDYIRTQKGIENILTVCRKGNCRINFKYDKKKLTKKKMKLFISDLKDLVTDGYVFVDDGMFEKNGRQAIEIAIEGQNPLVCRDIAEKTSMKIRGLKNIDDVVLNFKTPEKVIELVPYYEYLRFNDAWPTELGQSLYWELGTPVIDKVWKNGKEQDVCFIEKSYRNVTEDNLMNKNIYINSNLIKIKECTSILHTEDLGTINRKNNKLCSYFTVYVKGSEFKKVKNQIMEIMNKTEMRENYGYSFDRKTKDYEENSISIIASFLLALILLFILLCTLNEKIVSSLIMISIIPACFFLPLIIKLFYDQCLGMGDFIGMAVSAGIIINNAILIEKMGLEKNKKSIFVTNFTTVLGVIPILASGSSGYIKDLAFYMLFSSLAALAISFSFFPKIISGNTSARKCFLQVQ